MAGWVSSAYQAFTYFGQSCTGVWDTAWYIFIDSREGSHLHDRDRRDYRSGHRCDNSHGFNSRYGRIPDSFIKRDCELDRHFHDNIYRRLIYVAFAQSQRNTSTVYWQKIVKRRDLIGS
jgi:hypothetical protein